MTGLLITTYGDSRTTEGSMESRGRYMMQTLRRARDLLERIYESTQQPKPPATNGQAATPNRKVTQ